MSAVTLDADRAPAAAEHPGPSLWRLSRVELRKSSDTRAGRWLLLVVALLTLAVVALQLFFGDGAERTFAAYLATTQLSVEVLLPVLGILLVTSEWSQRTAMTTFTLVPRRSRVLVAKVLAGTALGLAGWVAALAVSALGVLLTPVLTHSAARWSVTGAQLGQVAVLEVLGVLGGVAFGVLLLSSPLAIVAWFVLPVVSAVLVNTVGGLTWARDWLDTASTTLPMAEGRLDGQGWLQVATSMALWLVLPLAVGWWRVERAEIS